MQEVLMVHAAATLSMVGLIWFVQVVHYPLMAGVGPDGFAIYAALHSTRTTWVVAPLMLIETAMALVLALSPPAGVSAATAWVGCGLLGIIWLSTALLQVPMHRRLAMGFDGYAYRRLVSSNWIRTAAWSARGFLALAWLA